MAKDMTLLWGSGSPPCWRIMITLDEKELKDYHCKLLSFEKMEHKSKEVMDMNPRGQVNTSFLACFFFFSPMSFQSHESLSAAASIQMGRQSPEWVLRCLHVSRGELLLQKKKKYIYHVYYERVNRWEDPRVLRRKETRALCSQSQYPLFIYFLMPPKTRASTSRREPSWPLTPPASSRWCTSACSKASPSPRKPVCPPNQLAFHENTGAACWVLVAILKRCTPGNILPRCGMPSAPVHTTKPWQCGFRDSSRWGPHAFTRGGGVTRLYGWKEHKRSSLKHFKQTYLGNYSNMSGWSTTGSVIETP